LALPLAPALSPMGERVAVNRRTGEGCSDPRAHALGHTLPALRALERAQLCSSLSQTSHDDVCATSLVAFNDLVRNRFVETLVLTEEVANWNDLL